jgi:hypothetical protein
MISSVFMSGRLGKVLKPGMRYVELDRLIPGPTGHFAIDKIPVKSQSFEEDSFLSEPEGAYICLQGRLETDPDYGIIVVIEVSEMYRFPKGTKQI